MDQLKKQEFQRAVTRLPIANKKNLVQVIKVNSQMFSK